MINQKIILKSIFSVLLVSVFSVLSSCGDDSSSTATTTSFTGKVSPYSLFQVTPENLCSNADNTVNIRNIVDPYYQYQKHLSSSSVNVEELWSINNVCLGAGVTVAVVDSGVEVDHPDLKENVDVSRSKDYSYSNFDFQKSSEHGTAVAGIIASAVNGYGVVGIAPLAKLVSYNLLINSSDINLIESLYPKVGVDVSNNSWGSQDEFPTLNVPNNFLKNVIDEGTTLGRERKGINYVFSAGNGRLTNNNSNYDSSVNYRKVIAVAALGSDGEVACYSEEGANILIAAAGGDANCDSMSNSNIVTTDLTTGGYNSNGFLDDKFTDFFSGTSAAAPMVSGVISLMLAERPDLTWRDVRNVLAMSAKKVDVNHSDWQQNGYDLWVNHNYGFGAVDAYLAVDLSKNWKLVENEVSSVVSTTYNKKIDDYDVWNPKTQTFEIQVNNSRVKYIESIELIANIEHPYWADLNLTLVSPMGTRSILTRAHYCEQRCGINNGQSLMGWKFSSTRYLNERSEGTWKLEISDGYSSDDGVLESVELYLYGVESLNQ